MKYQIKEFVEAYIDSAVNLFLRSYQSEKEKNTLLPSEIINEPERIINPLKSKIGNLGVAVFAQNKLIAYMITGATFDFKGQKTAMVPEYGHSSLENNKKELYQLMYMALSSEWIKKSIHLHIIGHFAHDSELKETIFQLGFGAILSEKVRDLSSINITSGFVINQENDPIKLIDIQLEHNKYYPQAPIFIIKNTERKKILIDLEEHKSNGDKFLVYYENDEPLGYFIIGESTQCGEGFLLQNTNTAQIKSAYIKPFVRGKGIGACLLKESINWSKENGFKRLFVEHETANYYGGNFWCKHFKPYLYFSMRYIDNAI